MVVDKETTRDLRILIIENPNLPIVVFVTDDANSGEHYNEVANITFAEIRKICKLNGAYYEEDDFEEKLADFLCEKEECKNLTGEQFNEYVESELKSDKYEKFDAIVIQVDARWQDAEQE